MNVVLTDHAREQALLRGATLSEIVEAISSGEDSPAKAGRRAFRKNFSFRSRWKGRYYETKQVMPVVAREDEVVVVITVYVFYFGEAQ